MTDTYVPNYTRLQLETVDPSLLPSVSEEAAAQAAATAYVQATGNPVYLPDIGVITPAVPTQTLAPATTGGVSAPAPLTVSVTKAATSQADETVEVTFAGGPSVKEQVVTWSFTSSFGQTPQNPVTIPIAHTAESAAKLLVAAETDTDLTSAVNGAVVIFTPKAGESITGLNISIS